MTPFYHDIRAFNCATRAPLVLVNLPNEPFVTSAEAKLLKLVWLNALKASRRNWNCTFSAIAKFFPSDKSVFQNPRLRTAPRPRLPGRIGKPDAGLIGTGMNDALFRY